ncbi:MAG: PilZ domain-containing protein [Nitrospirae bacterium]|nr:PilZ domain-containing protein [Nitrospirota bacterium]
MKLPVVATKAHQGKTLELDCERETITLLDRAGEQLGTITWESVIDHIRALSEKSRAGESRSQPRAPLVAKVKYDSTGGYQIESRASGIGGGGLFIESQTLLPIGTSISLEIALPDRPAEWLEAKGVVAWVCPKPDQYTSSPGMGVRFTTISAEVRERVLELVNSLKRPGRSA